MACAQIAIACIQANHCLNLGEFCFSQPHIRIQEVADLALPVAPSPRPSGVSHGFRLRTVLPSGPKKSGPR